MKIAEGSYRVGLGWWGLGGISSDRPEPGWQCPHHEGKIAKGDSRHHYDDGDVACTTCARAWLVSIGEHVSDPDKFEPVQCRIPVRTGANGRGVSTIDRPSSRPANRHPIDDEHALETAGSVELEMFAGVA